MDLDELLKQITSKRILEEIGNGQHRLMSCGEQRYAALLVWFKILERVSENHRFTSNYKLTPFGTEKIG